MVTYWISSKSILKFVRKRIPKFFIFHTTVTLNEGQGHPNWYQNVQLTSLYHQIKFKRNRSVNVWIQANIKRNHINKVLSFEYWMGKTEWVWVSSHQHVSTVHQIPFKSIDNFVRQLAQNFLLSSTPVTLNQGQGQLDYDQNVKYNSIYYHTKFESNPFINIPKHANVQVFWQFVKQQLFPFFQ